MPIQMELRRIIIDKLGDQQVIVLKEVEGERSFRMMIGPFEVTSINHRVQGKQAPRPLTHDLIIAVIDQLGGELQDVMITELKDYTYFARLRVRHEGELSEIDCRPSDAIAVAVTAKVPIYVSEDVLGDALDD